MPHAESCRRHDYRHLSIYRHALNAWVSPLATCALPKGVCYLLKTYLLDTSLSLTPLTNKREVSQHSGTKTRMLSFEQQPFDVRYKRHVRNWQ